MRKFLTKLFKKISPFKKKCNETILLKDIYGTKSQKSVLLSYIKAPFLTQHTKSHTNFSEATIIAEIFHIMGYSINVVEYCDQLDDMAISSYDVIFGFGKSLHRSFYIPKQKNIITVFYGTGCLPVLSNQLGLIRVAEIKDRLGEFFLESIRYLDTPWETTVVLSSALVILGNQFTAKTYTSYYPHPNLFLVPGFFYKIQKQRFAQKKNWQKARRTLLWLGSAGLIHKGYDLVVESFSNKPEYRLHVCGVLKNEEKFAMRVLEEFNSPANISMHGFIDIESDLFSEILEESGFVILPSLTEGSSPSVLTAMGNGSCIPIITEGASLSVQDFGFVMKEASVANILSAISTIDSMSEIDLENRSKAAFLFANEHHSVENYRQEMASAISKILG